MEKTKKIKNMKKSYRLIIDIGVMILSACFVITALPKTHTLVQAMKAKQGFKLPGKLIVKRLKAYEGKPWAFSPGKLIGVFQFVDSTPAIKEAIVLATTVKPETFTELYFEDHNNLPKTIERHEEYSFIFTIHNLEYKDMEYPYVVYLETIDKKIILDQNKISLKNGEYKSIRVDFGPLKNIRMKIVVELENKNQNISFWMEGQNEQL